MADGGCPSLCAHRFRKPQQPARQTKRERAPNRAPLSQLPPQMSVGEAPAAPRDPNRKCQAADHPLPSRAWLAQMRSAARFPISSGGSRRTGIHPPPTRAPWLNPPRYNVSRRTGPRERSATTRCHETTSLACSSLAVERRAPPDGTRQPPPPLNSICSGLLCAGQHRIVKQNPRST